MASGKFDMHSIAMLDMDATPLAPKIIYTGNHKFYGITRENPHDGSLWVNFNGSYGVNDTLVRLTRDGSSGLYAADAPYIPSGSYYFSSCPFFEDRSRTEVAESSKVHVVKEEDAVDLCDLVVDKDGFSVSVLFSDPTVHAGEWEVELEDHHTLKIISAPTESAEVGLKAFSCGLYSDVMFSFSLRSVPGYTLSLVSTGEGTLKVLRGAEELADGAALREGDELVITAVPKDGFILKTLVVNGAPFESGKTYTVGAQNVSVEAVFEKNEENAVESVSLARVAATPNPCGERLTLRGVAAAARWDVYTVQGQLVACGGSEGEETIEIATAGWIPGVYYMRLEATDGVRVLTVVKE